ncbi:MAG TPA: hypothetical protein VNJ47_07210 [Nevskiales bacterium]|nr:hypothetical protein [Nevskiales bacterium]
MKQNVLIDLRDYMERDDAWGVDEGREIHARLLQVVEANPGVKVFQISLKRVKRTDASAPRESVVELARRYRKDKGFCLVHVQHPDLRENWDAAALKKDQPLCIWDENRVDWIGPQASRGTRDVLDYVSGRTSPVFTSEVCKALKLTAQNASTKLKALWEKGYLLRQEMSAPTGGVEYAYLRIA